MDPDLTRIVAKLREARRRRPKSFGSQAHNQRGDWFGQL